VTKRVLGVLFLFFCSRVAAKGVVYIKTGCRDLFDITTVVNRDDVRRPFYDMREALRRLGYTVEQPRSLRNLHDVERIICFDVIGDQSDLNRYPKEKCLLFLWEPPTVCSANYNKARHKYFSRVYTLLDDLVDNKKYFKFYDPQPRLDMIESLVPFEEKKMCVFLTYNKHYSHPFSLSPERRKIIAFFERLDAGIFDLYGLGWPKSISKNYKGFAPSKVHCMKNYKFCFCYENMRAINGYITGEKIFNVFIAGCVPIYWGAENITEYIPKNCFVDRRDFGNYDELYQFLKSMTKQEYQKYIDNIRNFVYSDQALLFSSEYFADIFLEAVEPGYDKTIAFTKCQRVVVDRVHAYLQKRG